MMNSNKQEMKFKREKKETWKVLLTKATAKAKLCKEKFGAALPGRKTDPASKRNRLFLEYSVVKYSVFIRVLPLFLIRWKMARD